MILNINISKNNGDTGTVHDVKSSGHHSEKWFLCFLSTEKNVIYFFSVCWYLKRLNNYVQQNPKFCSPDFPLHMKPNQLFLCTSTFFGVFKLTLVTIIIRILINLLSFSGLASLIYKFSWLQWQDKIGSDQVKLTNLKISRSGQPALSNSLKHYALYGSWLWYLSVLVEVDKERQVWESCCEVIVAESPVISSMWVNKFTLEQSNNFLPSAWESHTFFHQ